MTRSRDDALAVAPATGVSRLKAGGQPTEEGSGLSGFLEIPWESSVEEAKAKMLAREGVEIDAKLSKDDVLAFRGGNLVGKPVRLYILVFFEGKFSKATSFLRIDTNRTIDEFNEIKGLVVQKYGKPDKDFSFFESPYRAHDGFENLAFEKEKAHFASFWEFPTPDRSSKNSLSCEVSSALDIKLNYEHHQLSEKMYERTKAKRASDL